MLNIIKNKTSGLINIISNIKFEYGKDEGPGHIVIFDGNINCSVIVVGEALGFYEKLYGRIFIGKSGSFLRNLMNDYIDSKAVGFVNSIYYKPFKNKTPCKSVLSNNINVFNDVVKIINPKYALAVGSVAKKCISLSNFVFDDVFHIYHPSYYLRNKEKHVFDNIVYGINKVNCFLNCKNYKYLLMRKFC